jgi:hypothetical protein
MSKCKTENDEMADAIGLLWLVRELLRANFDVKMYIPDSYIKSVNQGKVANFEIRTVSAYLITNKK